MLTPIQLDTDARLGFRIAFIAFVVSLCLAALALFHGCANWKSVARETLKYHEAIITVANDGLREACNDAIAECEAKRLDNPCPMLEFCIAKIEPARLKLRAYTIHVKDAYQMLSDAETAIKTGNILMKEAGFLIGILGQIGVNVEAQIKRLVP